MISWDDQLARYLDSHFTDVEQQAAYAPRPVAILTCPEDHTPRSGYVNPTNGAPVYPRSYGVSCWPGKADGYVTFEGVGGQMSTAEPIPWALIAKSLCVKQSWIRMPVQTILAFDYPDKVNSLGGIISYAGRPYDQTVDIVGYANLGKIGCHGKGWNYAFCDGHVELLTPDQTVRPAGSTYASYLGNNYMWTRDPND